MEARKTVIITGATGYIGKNIADKLSKEFNVVGLDRTVSQETSGIQYFECDLSSSESVFQALAKIKDRYGEEIASVIHLAAFYDFSGKENPKYEEITVKGTERLLKALDEFLVEQFIFSSTLLVHTASPPGKKTRESSHLDPKWPYPESKVKTERLIALHAKKRNMSAIMMRLAGVYDDSCHSLPLAHQIHHIYEKMFISHFFPGKRNSGQPFVHIDDVVEAFYLAVKKRHELAGIHSFLIGEDETLSYEHLQEEIGRMLHNKKWTTARVPKFVAQFGAWIREKLPFREEPLVSPKMIPFADEHYEIDISFAKELLGWAPRRHLKEALPQMIKLLKENPNKWYKENKIEPPSKGLPKKQFNKAFNQ